MTRIVLISYTPRSWSGGVNRWVNDFITGFPDAIHFSFHDVLTNNPGIRDSNVPEIDKARVLNAWLKWAGKIKKNDIIVVDGFWGAGLSEFPNVVSVCHGNWSHLTLEDVQAGKQPEFPQNHLAQVKYRTEHVKCGGRLVAVSDFISTQCKLQWGWDIPVINNAVDLERFRPSERVQRDKVLVIHGVNDRTNQNKGWDHIEAVKEKLNTVFLNGADVLSLDEARERFGTRDDEPGFALGQADIVVIPSGHEGNSYFLLETLACDVSVFAYDVGLAYKAFNESLDGAVIGHVARRSLRSPDYTAGAVCDELILGLEDDCKPREWVSQFSIQSFHKEWKEYLMKEFQDANLFARR